MLRTFLVAQTLALLTAVLMMLGAVVARKIVVDRRTLRSARGRAEVHDGVFAFVVSDGRDSGAIDELIPAQPGPRRLARTTDVCNEVIRLTADLRGEVKAHASALVHRLGWAEVLSVRLEHSRNSGERARAAARLGDLGSEESESLVSLVRALRDPDAAVRICAARALGKCGDLSMAPALISAARDGRIAIGIVAEALVGLGPGVEPVVTYATGDGEPCVRRLATDVIGALRLPGARRAALTLLDDPDETVRVAAAKALGRIGWPDIAPELSLRCTSGGKRLRLAAVESMVELQAPEGVPVLAAAMGDPDHLVAHRAAQGLAGWADLAGSGLPTARSALGVLKAVAELDTRAGTYAREALARFDEAGAS